MIVDAAAAALMVDAPETFTVPGVVRLPAAPMAKFPVRTLTLNPTPPAEPSPFQVPPLTLRVWTMVPPAPKLMIPPVKPAAAALPVPARVPPAFTWTPPVSEPFSVSVPAFTTVELWVLPAAEIVRFPKPFLMRVPGPETRPPRVVFCAPSMVRPNVAIFTAEVTFSAPFVAVHVCALPSVTPVVRKPMVWVFTELTVIPLESVIALPPSVKAPAPALKVIPATVAVAALLVVMTFATPANCRPTAKFGGVFRSQLVAVAQLPSVSPSQTCPAFADIGTRHTAMSAATEVARMEGRLREVFGWVFFMGIRRLGELGGAVCLGGRDSEFWRGIKKGGCADG